MKTCAFLSMDSLNEFVCYDHLLFDPLQKLGWTVDVVSWRNPEVNWDDYDAVIIRSPWDYQQDSEAFLDVLEQIEVSGAVLENNLDLIKWNINKSYLRDLQKQGIEIVPTLWKDTFQKRELKHYFDQLKIDEIIIKPTVGANADDTFRIKKEELRNYRKQLADIFSDTPFMVQPFMKNIINEGEFSLFFFGDSYSHTILKTPKSGDFRVQEEHGGRLQTVKPESHLREVAQKTLHNINPQPLYSRVDFVRTPDGSFALMELELIEPSLYFNMDSESPKRFAEVFDQWME